MRYALAACLFALSCDKPRHPWDQGDAAPVVSSASPPIRSLTSSSAAPGASAAPALSASTLAPPVEPEAPSSPVRVGGPWVRCYGGFRPSNDPLKDVTRLSLLCGPLNGMKRFGKDTFEGVVGEGSAPKAHSIDVKRGECYRVFAVADAGVADLDVVVRSGNDSQIAADHGEDRWPIVQPDRPFCPLADDRYKIEVSARKGAGRYAAEVWVLKAAPPK